MKNSFKSRDLYCVWFGDKMSMDRERCYNSILKNSNVNVILVTEKNLDSFILEDAPLPMGFNFLSNSHKSDYLRSYLMHHYGGAYTDIKQTDFDFNPYFDMLEKSDKYCIGYVEEFPDWIKYQPVKDNYKQYIGTGMMIHKPKTNLSKRWEYLTNKTIVKNYNQLKKYPGTYHPRAIYGGILDNKTDFKGSKYPFFWEEVGPVLWHRAQHDNFGTWMFGLPHINMNNYR